MQTPPEFLDLTAAAQIAGVHRTTLFRAIHRGELIARKLQVTGGKAQYLLGSLELDCWLKKRVPIAQFAGAVAQVAEIAPSAPSVQYATGTEQVAQLALLQDFNLNLREALRQADIARTQEQLARNEASRLERQVIALQYELAKYQLSLAETAESLQEARALRVAAEERAQVAEALPATPEVDQAVELTVIERMPSMDTRRQGWGSRLRRWMLGQKTG
jgi:hypothetical protein